MGIKYCTREDVQGALDVQSTARDDDQVDRLIEAASRSVEATCHRVFYPTLATRYFDWPNDQRAVSWRVWLDANELISATSVLSGGVAVTAYFLEPANYGPPYDRIELNIGTSPGFSVGPTYQRNIAITGLYGYSDDQRPAGALVGAIAAGDTALTVSSGVKVGIGSLLSVGTERLEVTGRSMADSGRSLFADVAGQANAVILEVDGSPPAPFEAGELLLVDSERLRVVDVAGNNVIVKRAVDGSVLAAHSTGATVYASRRLQVSRGALGTVAASHLDAAAVTSWLVPGPVRQLTIAESLNALEQESSGYARTIGSGETVRNAGGGGLADMRASVYTSHGRKARSRAV